MGSNKKGYGGKEGVGRYIRCDVDRHLRWDGKNKKKRCVVGDVTIRK